MITPKESNLVDIINQQHKQALALKARQPMPGGALITKLTSASRRLDSGDAIGVWLKVTFNFGDKGYFIGEISISEIRYDNSINGFYSDRQHSSREWTGNNLCPLHAGL